MHRPQPARVAAPQLENPQGCRCRRRRPLPPRRLATTPRPRRPCAASASHHPALPRPHPWRHTHHPNKKVSRSSCVRAVCALTPLLVSRARTRSALAADTTPISFIRRARPRALARPPSAPSHKVLVALQPCLDRSSTGARSRRPGRRSARSEAARRRPPLSLCAPAFPRAHTPALLAMTNPRSPSSESG
jgi:hypothetical protein